MRMEMKRQDMEELYQLLVIFVGIHGSGHAAGLLKEVAGLYSGCYGEDISGKKNPRNAGRKKQHTEEDRAKIRELREKGKSIREISRETGCSIWYVHGVLSGP